MLNVATGCWADLRGTGELDLVNNDFAVMALNDLLILIDRFVSMPPLHSYNRHGDDAPGAVRGDHAWVSVIDRGFVFHVYFSEDEPTFELYGPFPPGHEAQQQDPYDGSGLAGSMSIKGVRQVITLLDGDQSPRE